MIQQLDIFSLPAQSPSSELPKAIIPVDPKVEAALNCLLELKALSIPSLVEGCIVRSSTSFKEQTGKLLRFEVIANIEFAIVEFLIRGSVIQYPCTIATLEVVT
jgi:hypothetical protein